MADLGQQARFAAARRRVSRAAGLLRDAKADLAAASDSASTVAVVHASADRHGDSDRAVRSALVAALTKYGEVDVVILARPGGHPPTAALAAKETPHDGTTP